MNIASTRIVIFAKAPEAGKVKTRLIPALGPQGACRFAGALLGHAVKHALTADIGPVELCASPAPSATAWQQAPLDDGLFSENLAWPDQGNGDLGARLARAVERVTAGGEMSLLIGADCPGLTPEHLRRAAATLQEHPAVMIPANDGGYVLLGLSQPVPGLFDGMAWSTETVAEETRQRLSKRGLSWVEFEPLVDIDEPSDLAFLPKSLSELAKALAEDA